MNKRLTNLIVAVAILASIAGLVLLGVNLFKSSPNVSWMEIVTFAIGSVLPVVGFALQLLDKYSVRFFIFANQLRSLFMYEPMRWSISADFDIEKPIDGTKALIDRVVSAIQARPDHKPEYFKVTHIEPSTYEIITPDGPTLRIKINHDDGGSKASAAWSLHLTIDNYRVGYNQVQKILSREIMPVLETIQNALRSNEARYSLTASFPNQKNPFFGFFVAQLPASVVTAFNIRLKFDAMSSHVDISKDNLRLNSTSQNSFRELAVEFLAFSNTLGEKLKHV